LKGKMLKEGNVTSTKPGSVEVIYCPGCGRIFGEWLVSPPAVFIKNKCPKCKKIVIIEKKS